MSKTTSYYDLIIVLAIQLLFLSTQAIMAKWSQQLPLLNFEEFVKCFGIYLECLIIVK